MDQITKINSTIPASFTIKDCFITFGLGTDLDNAIDDATSSAWYELGRSHTEPSIVSIKPEKVRLYSEDAFPQDSARNLAFDMINTLNPGDCVAIKIASPANFKKRKVLVKFDDPSLELPEGVGRVIKLAKPIMEKLEILAEKKAEEIVGSIEVKKQKRKTKVSTIKTTGKKASYWVLSEDLSKGFTSQFASFKEAKMEASALMKSSPKKKVNIYQISGKGEEAFVLGYKRNLLKQSALLKVELLERNTEVKEKTIGFILVGRKPVETGVVDAR